MSPFPVLLIAREQTFYDMDAIMVAAAKIHDILTYPLRAFR